MPGDPNLKPIRLSLLFKFATATKTLLITAACTKVKQPLVAATPFILVSVLTCADTFVQTAPAIAQGVDHGPAILVPTDVTGTQIMEVDAPHPEVRIKFEKFPEKFNCKKCLIQEDTDTKYGALSEGAITLESGKILVAPQDGRVLVRTKLADIAVPKDGIALIKCENKVLSIFNLAGRESVIKFPKEEESPHSKTKVNECIGLDEGFGIISNSHKFTKDSIASGVLQYVGTSAASVVVIEIAMHDCKLAVIDPMRILQNDSILKFLTAEKWLSVLRKVEDTTDRVGVWQKEELRR